MNANEATTIIFILSIVGSLSGVVTGLLPPALAPIVIAIFGVISELTNYLKSGYADKTKVVLEAEA